MALTIRSKYKKCFLLDGKEVPTPSTWDVKPQILTKNSKRKISTAALRAQYITTVYTITWVYKYITTEDYQELYKRYVLSVDKNKSIKHCIATIDSNLKAGSEPVVMCTKVYTQDDFQAPLYRIDPKTGEHYYKDVTFTFVGCGGKFDTHHYFIPRNVWQSGSSSVTPANYVANLKACKSASSLSANYEQIVGDF